MKPKVVVKKPKLAFGLDLVAKNETQSRAKKPKLAFGLDLVAKNETLSRDHKPKLAFGGDRVIRHIWIVIDIETHSEFMRRISM